MQGELSSMAKILVAYASKQGSTAEIAQAIAHELQAAGRTADAADVAGIASLAGYAGVVIGGPMYMGHIDPRVGKFMKRHAGGLAQVPVAGFVVCLAAASKDPEGMAWAGKALTKALAPVRAGRGDDLCGEARPGETLVVPALDHQEGELTGRGFSRLGRDRGLGPGGGREDGGVK